MKRIEMPSALCNVSVFTESKQTHVDAVPASRRLLLTLIDAGQVTKSVSKYGNQTPLKINQNWKGNTFFF